MKKKPVLLVCLVLFIGSAFGQSETDFTIVVLPDTQYYSASYPQIFNSQTQWIASHVQDMKIRLVLGVGDVVDLSNATQWQNADTAIKYLDGVVPYLLAIGNHDYDKGDKAPLKRLAAGFNQYFGPARYAGYSYYRGSFPPGSNENFYGIVNVNGRDVLILLLEFYPRSASLAWASSILKANSDKETIVVTHSYGYGGGRMTTCDSTASEAYGLNYDNDGDELWDFLSQYPNIILVLSGHVTSYNGVGRRADLGVNGNLVNQVLADYQGYVNGGNGYLRIMNFQPALNRVQVTTYSPYTGTYLTDSANQFTLTYHRAATSARTAAITGRVTEAATCVGIVGAVVTNGVQTVLTDQYGNYNLTSLLPGQQAITVSKAGFINATKQATLFAGYNVSLKFALAIAPPE